jgi:2-polyprenyl-3-methyl-5-hydroxy-6-metoxy-1,4-benzoquinol methylase
MITCPDTSELDGALQHQIHEIDLREIHNPDRLTRLDYRIRLAMVTRLVASRVTPGAIVIDLGSASGNLVHILRAEGLRAVATDLRLDYLRYARLKSRAHPFPAIVCNGEALPLRASAASAVVLGEILEHVAHPDRLLAEAAQVLEPGGLIVATSPNGSHRWNPLPTFSDAKGHLEEYEPRQFGPDGGDHLFLYTAEELHQLLLDAGFERTSTTYFYSDLLGRAVARIQGLSSWSRMSRTVSAPAARALALGDQLALKVLPRRRIALGLVVAARRR